MSVCRYKLEFASFFKVGEGSLYPNLARIAYKKDKSLKDLLVRAKIPPQP